MPDPAHRPALRGSYVCGGEREGFLWPFWKCEAGTERPESTHTIKSIQRMFSCSLWSQLLTLVLASHMEAITRGDSSLQALVSRSSEASQATSFTLRPKPCSLPQRQAGTGPGAEPGFPEPQPSAEASSAACPHRGWGRKGRAGHSTPTKIRHQQLPES